MFSICQRRRQIVSNGLFVWDTLRLGRDAMINLKLVKIWAKSNSNELMRLQESVKVGGDFCWKWWHFFQNTGSCIFLGVFFFFFAVEMCKCVQKWPKPFLYGVCVNYFVWEWKRVWLSVVSLKQHTPQETECKCAQDDELQSCCVYLTLCCFHVISQLL